MTVWEDWRKNSGIKSDVIAKTDLFGNCNQIYFIRMNVVYYFFGFFEPKPV